MNALLTLALLAALPPQAPQPRQAPPVRDNQPCIECGGACDCVQCDCALRLRPVAPTQTICEGGVCRVVVGDSYAPHSVPPVAAQGTWSQPILFQPMTARQAPAPQYVTYSQSQPVRYVQQSQPVTYYQQPPQPARYTAPTYQQQPAMVCQNGTCRPVQQQSAYVSAPTYYSGSSVCGPNGCGAASSGRTGLFGRRR